MQAMTRYQKRSTIASLRLIAYNATVVASHGVWNDTVTRSWVRFVRSTKRELAAMYRRA